MLRVGVKATSMNGSNLQMRGLPHIFQGLSSHQCVGVVGAISPKWLFAASDGLGLLQQCVHRREHTHTEFVHTHKNEIEYTRSC